MALSLEEVEYIAELARLRLDGAERELFREQLSAILDYASRLQQLDTSGVLATVRLCPPRSPLREDQPRAGLDPQSLLHNAPQTDKGQFRIPLVLEFD